MSVKKELKIVLSVTHSNIRTVLSLIDSDYGKITDKEIDELFFDREVPIDNYPDGALIDSMVISAIKGDKSVYKYLRKFK